jgi:hypothetical protein
MFRRGIKELIQEEENDDENKLINDKKDQIFPNMERVDNHGHH